MNKDSLPTNPKLLTPGLLALALFLLLPGLVKAGTENWQAAKASGAASGTWTVAANWYGTGSAPPTSADSVVFNTNNTAAATVLTATKTAIVCNDMTFGGNTYGNDSGWIVSGTSMTIASGTVTVNALASGASASIVDAGKPTLPAAPNNLTKKGPGWLSWSGSMNASSGCGLVVQNGTLQLSDANVTKTASNGTWLLGDSSGDSGVIVIGAGSANFALASTLQSASGAGSACAVVGGATATSTLELVEKDSTAYPINFGGSSGNQANLSLTLSSGTANLSGVMNFNGGLTLLKGTMTISGNNTTCGGITLGSGAGAGTLILGGTGAYPSAKDNLTISSGTVDLHGFSATVNNLSAAASQVVDTLAAGTPTLTISSGTAAVIKNTSGTLAVTKTGTGALTIIGADTYGGNTTISQGTLTIGTGGSIANTPTITVAASSTFDVSAVGITLGSGQTLAFSGNGAAGTINTAAAKSLTLGTTSPLLFSAYNGTAAGTVAGAGNLVLASGNPVTVTVSNGGTPLAAGTYTLITAGVSGSAPAGVTVNGNGAAGGTTKTLAINAGALQLNVVTGPSAYAISGGSSLTAGGSENLTITALNGSGATLATFSANETLSFYGLNSVGGNAPKITDKNGTAQSVTASAGTPNVTLTFVNGVATVSSGANGVLTAYAAGSSTLNCTDGTATSTGGDPSAAGLSLAVSVASVGKMVMATEPSSPVTAGAVFSTQPAVDLEDTYGNLETGDSTSVVTAGVDTGTGPFTGTTTATAVSGVATFSGLAGPTLAQTGLKLQFTDTGDSLTALNDATSITVNPGTASKLAVTTGAGLEQTDAQNFTPSPVISVEDQYGNVVTSDSSTVVANVLTHSGTGTLGGTTTQAASSGVATFGALNYTLGSSTAAETVQVQYTDGGLTAVNNSSLTVNPDLTISFSSPPTATTAGATINSGSGVVVNVVTTAGSSPVPDGTPVTMFIATGSGTLLGTLNQTTVSGNATFSDLSIKAAGSDTLKAAVGTQSTTSGSFSINAGSYSQLQVLLPGQTAAPGTGSGFTGTASNAHLNTAYAATVNAVDACYNLVNTVNDSFTVAASDSDSGLAASPTLASGTVSVSLTPSALTNLAPGITLTATDGSTTGTSSAFLVYHQNPYYRSTASGNWSVAATWQSSTDDGNTWATASVTPETSGNPADLVEVTNNAGGTAVTVTANTALTVTNLIIYAGSTNSVNGVTFTIAHPVGANPAVYPADDCDVFGTLAISTTAGSAVAESGTPVVVFESDGACNLGIAGGTIPAATWNAASTFTYSPTAASAAVPTGLNQNFGNFVWLWTAQSGSAQNLAGLGLTNIQGNLEISSSTSAGITMGLAAGTVGYVVNIGGTLKIHDAKFFLAGGGNGNTGQWDYKLGGGFTVDNANGGTVGTWDFSNAGTAFTNLLEFTGAGCVFNDDAKAPANASGSYQVDSGATLTLGSGAPVGGTGTAPNSPTFVVQGGGTLVCGANAVTGNGAFTLASTGTLEIGSAAGITSSGATGNIQTSGTRHFDTGASYVYNGTSSQVLGNGLPATVNNLTLATGMTDSVTVVPPAPPGGTAISDVTVYNVTGTLTANNAVIGYTVGGGGNLIRGTYPVFDYGTLSGSFGTPSKVSGTQGNAPTLSTGSGVVALTVANNAPTATAVTSNVVTGASIKIPVSSLIAAGNDFDGDTLSFSSVDATTAGGKTISNNGSLVYVPATSNGDTFNYVLSDGFASVSNLVTIDVVAGTGQQGSLTAVGGTVTGAFFGVPGTQYYIQTTATLPGPWTDLNGGSPYTADATTGVINFTDTPGGSSAFYRLSTDP